MKVLYINYILQKGHINFDHIHIDALINHGQDVKLVLHKKIAEQLPYPNGQYALTLPSILDCDTHNPLINRLLYMLTLIYIRMKVHFGNYDKVILSSLEEISLGIFPLCREMHIFCHDNGKNIGKGIKGFFIKRISRHNSFIVFNQEMAIPFNNHQMRYHVISHGCVQPFKKAVDCQLPLDIHSFHTIIYHPSCRPNPHFIDELKKDEEFQDFLKDNNMLLILRDQTPQKNISNHIIYINHFLTRQEYQTLFLNSDIIILAYPDDFNCRVSGVSFECVANHKRLLVRDSIALRYCKDFYNYNPMFTNLSQLQERIIFLNSHPKACCTATLKDLRPDYTKLLS